MGQYCSGGRSKSGTVLSDNQNAGLGRSVTRNDQVFLLWIAALLFAVQVIAYLNPPTPNARRRTRSFAIRRAEREKPVFEEFMSSEIMHQIIETIEEEVNSRPSPIEFEMAYQARVAIDRIRFAIKHTEQFCARSDPLREAGLQLLDALERLETVERRFQQRSRMRRRVQNGVAGSAARNGNGGCKEVLS